MIFSIIGDPAFILRIRHLKEAYRSKYNLSLNSTGYKSAQATCKSVIGGEKLSKAKKYSLTGK